MNLIAADWNYHERIEKEKFIITSWIEKSHMSVKAKARFERALDQLKRLPKTSWSKPNPASSLGHNTYVIRFKDVSGAQMRVFGHFYDPHSSFVMTFTGTEKDDVYYPTDYEKMAKQYRDFCNKDFSKASGKYRHYCALCSTEAVPNRRR